MENKLNENDVIVGDEAKNKSMFASKENVSTESANRSDSGIQVDVMLISESNLTESKIMGGVTNQSTLIPVKKDDSSDIINMMKSLIEKQNIMLSNKFDVQNNKFDVKFDKINTVLDVHGLSLIHI